MTTLELISKLWKIHEENGDLPVYIPELIETGDGYEITNVNVAEPFQRNAIFDEGPKPYPKRVEIS